jgi:hypothetical protein
MRLQFRFGAECSRHGKIRHVNAGKRHGKKSFRNFIIW